MISVTDNGVGIKRQDQKKLFKMFSMLKSTSQMNTNGIGLGLFITKQIVSQFDGKVLVRSKYRKGSQFIFTLLINKVNDEEQFNLSQS